jgi:hypothetical protein
MPTPRTVILLNLLVAALAAAAPTTARATQVQVTSSTQFLWYEDLLSNHLDQQDVAEYLRLNLLSLDQAGKVNVYGYGRIVGQLTSDPESRPKLLGDDTTGRLYYLFLDYRDLVPGHLDLKAGRTFIPAAAIPGVVDGLQLRLRDLGTKGLGVTAFGGRRVLFDNKVEVGGMGDLLAGGSVYYDTVKATHAELSYAQKWTDERFAQEMVAFDLSSTPHQMVNLVGRLQYDLVSSKVSELTLGANVFPIKDLVLRGEFCDSRPTFDKSSFYRYFDVDDYKVLGASAEYRLAERYRVSGKLAAEDFDRKSTAHVWGLGLFARPIDALTLNVSYDQRNGFGSRLSGLRFNGAYKFWKATVLAGIDYDDFRRADARSDTAKKYWAGGEVQLNPMFGLSLRVEKDVTFYFSDAYQGFAALHVNI